MRTDDTLPPGMTTHTFGDHLKREREMRGVSLEEISIATRIGTRFLEAFENEQWDRLPGGVFNRGFVRAIARYLGLNEENLLAEYALALDGQPETPAWTGAGYPPAARASWGNWLLATIVAIAILGGAIALWRHFAAKRATAKPGSVTMGNPASPTRNTSPGTVLSSTTPNAPAESSNGTGIPPEAVRRELKLQTGDESTRTVVAGGEEIADGKMDAGETRPFSAREKLAVSGSNASAALLVPNGPVLPPPGTPGHLDEATLRRENMKHPAGGNH